MPGEKRVIDATVGELQQEVHIALEDICRKKQVIKRLPQRGTSLWIRHVADKNYTLSALLSEQTVSAPLRRRDTLRSGRENAPRSTQGRDGRT